MNLPSPVMTQVRKLCELGVTPTCELCAMGVWWLWVCSTGLVSAAVARPGHPPAKAWNSCWGTEQPRTVAWQCDR